MSSLDTARECVHSTVLTYVFGSYFTDPNQKLACCVLVTQDMSLKTVVPVIERLLAMPSCVENEDV